MSLYIATYGGRLLDLENLGQTRVNSIEMARALSRIPRYNGNTNFTWSVAQHSLLVSQILKDNGESAEVQLAGLLHDASEHLISDLSKPIKDNLPGYSEYETMIEDWILASYGLDSLEKYGAYKLADAIALYTEASVLMGRGTEWELTFQKEYFKYLDEKYIEHIKIENEDLVSDKFLARLISLLREAGCKHNHPEHRQYETNNQHNKITVVGKHGILHRLFRESIDNKEYAAYEADGKRYIAKMDVIKYIKELGEIISEQGEAFHSIFKEVSNGK